MKKLFALILAVMMLVSIGCAWAEGKTEALPEITFRGVPFGSTWAEFRNTLDVLKDQYPQGFSSAWEYTPLRIEDIILEGNYNASAPTGNPLLKDVIFCSQGMWYYFRVTNTTVAGYEVNQSEIFFVRPVVDGAINANNDASLFYAAYYEFVNRDDAMEADLTAKLSGLYGTPESVTTEKGKNYIIWYGSNDTEVALYRDGSVIRLVYAWRGAEALLDEALAVAAANQPPAEDISGNISGL